MLLHTFFKCILAGQHRLIHCPITELVLGQVTGQSWYCPRAGSNQPRCSLQSTYLKKKQGVNHKISLNLNLKTKPRLRNSLSGQVLWKYPRCCRGLERQAHYFYVGMLFEIQSLNLLIKPHFDTNFSQVEHMGKFYMIYTQIMLHL